MTTLVDGNGTIFMVNDNNGLVVEAIATNSDGSTYTTQWDTQNETTWASRTEWDNAAGQLTQDEVTFKDGSTAWQFFNSDGSLAFQLGNTGEMKPNAANETQTVFADLITANISGFNMPMGFQAGEGWNAVSGASIDNFNAAQTVDAVNVVLDALSVAQLAKLAGPIGSTLQGFLAGVQLLDIIKDWLMPATSPQAPAPSAPVPMSPALAWALDQYGASYGANYDGHSGVGPMGANGLLGHV